MKVILASASPRRSELLQRIGVSFHVIVSQVEEVITKEKPWEVVEELSFQKAIDVADNMDTTEDVLVIGADTIVALDNRIMGKPRDLEDAKEMLQSLQGTTHQVYTGVTLVYIINGQRKCHTFFEKTDVQFYPMSDEEITYYVETKDPIGKAGAYGIQSLAGIYIEKIDGDYNNVVGLPIARLYQEVKKDGYSLQ